EQDRKSIFSIHLSLNGQNPENFGLERLAKESVSFNGAEIEGCVKEAMFTAYAEKPEYPKLQIMHLLAAIKDTIPLAKTMKGQIEFLRKWAKSRAKYAGEEFSEVIVEEKGVPLTKV